MKQKSLKKLEKQVKDFNEKYPVGSIARVQDDFGITHKRSVLNEAQVLGGHSAVGWFEGVSGCYSLDRVF